MDKIKKLEMLMRRHRQMVFSENGELHTRALIRLKKTKTFKAMCQDNKDRAKRRLEMQYERMGY